MPQSKLSKQESFKFFPKTLAPLVNQQAKYIRRTPSKNTPAQKTIVRNNISNNCFQSSSPKPIPQNFRRSNYPLKKFKIYRKKRCEDQNVMK
mmetsp:Transcript_15422/g.15285  ORF Transcript_15422/g.15285 Transcript_15422/m.15285 type:complete len:92 (+) Transcript_15422:442-717(+)